MSKISPNPPSRLVSKALMRMPHKQFGHIASELMRKKKDMVFHARHHVYTRTKKRRSVIG